VHQKRAAGGLGALSRAVSRRLIDRQSPPLPGSEQARRLVVSRHGAEPQMISRAALLCRRALHALLLARANRYWAV